MHSTAKSIQGKHRPSKEKVFIHHHPENEKAISPLDILPGLKAGDSYGAQARHRAAPKSLRWVPAAGAMTSALTSQANRA
ncbi:hypothetical protein NJC38_10495, partial [Pseudomonas sp. 21LCFQ010]|uniref:hypothetical protein n=1 Tax=Pseudomonas sp. 21LCFQ010 TaxID=2957506 RepID=UPI002097A41F